MPIVKTNWWKTRQHAEEAFIQGHSRATTKPRGDFHELAKRRIDAEVELGLIRFGGDGPEKLPGETSRRWTSEGRLEIVVEAPP